MRRLALVLGAVVLTNCSKPETPPAETAPPALTMADLAGTWNMEVRGLNSDSVLTTSTLAGRRSPPRSASPGIAS